MARSTIYARESNRFVFIKLNLPFLFLFQLSRSVSDLGTKPIYPWPKQVFTPNNDYSKENSATNIVKNKERTTMETTYQSDYNGTDGLGSHVIFDTTVSLSPTEKLVKMK